MTQAIQAHDLEALHNCLPKILKEWNSSNTFNSCCYVAIQCDEPEMLRIVRLHSMSGDHDNGILLWCMENGNWACARVLMECMDWGLVPSLRDKAKAIKTAPSIKMGPNWTKNDDGLHAIDFLNAQLSDPSLYAARIHHACIVAGDWIISDIFSNTQMFFDLFNRSQMDVTPEILFHGLVKGGGICAQGLLERASPAVVEEAINTFGARAAQYNSNHRFQEDPQLLERVQSFVVQCSHQQLTTQVPASSHAPNRRLKI